MIKKISSIMLAVLMIITFIPMSTFAETSKTTEEELKETVGNSVETLETVEDEFAGVVDNSVAYPKYGDVLFSDQNGNYTTDDSKKFLKYTVYGAGGSDYYVRVSAAGNEIYGDITIPSSLNDGTFTYYVKEIAEKGFLNYRFIDNVVISEGVTTINTSAFQYCHLKNVYIPNSLETINAWAFYSRSGDTRFFMKPVNPPFISNTTAFEKLFGFNNIYVPKGSVEAYARRGGYYHYIYELPEVGDICYLDINGDVCNDVSSRVYEVTLTQVFPFKGKIRGVNNSLSGEIKIPANFDYCDDTVDITEIAYDGFRGFDKITKVIMPDTVLKIDFNAFVDCSSLESVTMSSNLKEIGSFAFIRCSKLTDIIIPYDVSVIDVEAFAECSSLKSVRFKGNLKSIKNYAFKNCESLESISIPNTVTDIGIHAFENTGLTSVVIPKTVTSIGNYAFANCDNLAIVKVGAYDPPVLGEDVFVNDNKNLRIQVPDASLNTYKNTEKWKAYADLLDVYVEEVYYTDANGNFTNDDAKKVFKFAVTDEDLKEVVVSRASDSVPNKLVIPSSITIGTLTFNVIGIDDFAFNSLVSLDSVVIPNGIRTIGNNAFNNCNSLKSLVIPSSVIRIGSSAFSNCTSLVSVLLPDSMKTIDDYAFSSCKSLEKIDIPEEITSIGGFAFFYCSKLREVNVFSDEPPVLGNQAFSYCAYNLKINVPGSFLNAYKYADGWKNYADHIYSNFLDKVFYADKNGKNTDDDAKKVFKYTVISVKPLAVSVSSANTAISDDLTIKSTFEYDDHEFAVVAIDDEGFAKCSNLESIKIPVNITSIGNSAFANCDNLIEVVVDSTVPPSLGDDAFSSSNENLRICVQKESLDTYKNANNWKNYIDKLDKIAQQDEVHYTDIDGNYTTDDAKKALKYTVIDPKTLAVSVSKVNSSLSGDISIPLSFTDGISTFNVTTIHDDGFAYCADLTSIDIPSSITGIGNRAFEYCNSLTTFNIPNSTKVIGNSAFEHCTALTDITIPSSVISIGDNTFYQCDDLRSVIFEEGITNISKYAFSSCDKLENVIIPSSVKTIGDGAFTSCDSLVNISIPEGVTSIGVGAFSWCKKLMDVSISNTIKTINDNAFAYCASLEEITIPYNVDSIGYHAFYACRQLSEVNIEISIPQYLDKGAFGECNSNLIIYVPKGSADDYKIAPNWSDYKDRIKEDDRGKGGDIDVEDYIETIKGELEEIAGSASERSLDMKHILEEEICNIDKCVMKDEVDDEVDIALNKINHQLQLDQNITENIISGCVNNTEFIKTNIGILNNAEAAEIIKNDPDISLALKEGNVIHIYAEIKDILDKDIFKKFNINDSNAVLFDASLYSSVDGKLSARKEITDTNDRKVKISITLSKEQSDKIIASNKEYYILRKHNDSFDKLPCTVTKEDDHYIVTFENDLFSSFAICSKNILKPIPNTALRKEND